MDADGWFDLIAANSREDTVSVLRNQGDGSFAMQVTYSVKSSPIRNAVPMNVVAADLTGDGAVDLITANENDDTIAVLKNLGDGSFAEVAQMPVRAGRLMRSQPICVSSV